MIITLSSRFASFSQQDWQPYILPIENLVKSHLQGWHFFVPDRRSVNRLIEHPLLGDRIKEALSVLIAERISVLQGYANAASYKMVCEIPLMQGAFQANEVRVDINAFADLDNCLKSKLIVENAESDGDFYIMVAQEMVAIGSLLPSLSLDVVAGGGQTTANRVAEAVSSFRPSLAIVDSDRIHPLAPVGPTASAVQLAFNQSFSKNHHIVITAVRALENFIPFSTAKHFIEDPIARRMAEGLATWQAMEVSNNFAIHECATAFYGAKKGLRQKAYRLSDPIFQKTIGDLCAHMGIAHVAPAPRDNSQDSRYVIPPLSSNYASLFLSKVREIGFSIIADDMRNAPFHLELTAIASLVADYGAAPLKSAARI
jgi:hypothetical protein